MTKKLFIRKSLLFTSLFFLFTNASSQINIFKDSTSIASFRYFRGNIIQIGTDSVVILNNKTHVTYQGALEDRKNYKNAVNSFQLMIESFKTDSAASAERYAVLKLLYDSISTEAKSFNSKTEVNLTSLDKSLTDASAKAAHINQLIDEAMTDTDRIRHRRWGWMIGGFSVGIGAASLVYLITR
ncbi:MAG TPA: hypothetical protein VK666_16475 [Chryseolinea sp.]|nr:hypothetical protein [Chryseolinea sp.]